MDSEILIGIVVVLFNAGGFVYLARNHFAHVNQKLDNICARLGILEQRVARMEGALRLPPGLTEH